MKLLLSCSALLALVAAPSLHALNMAHPHAAHKAKASQAHATAKSSGAKSASTTRHTAAAHAAAHTAGHAAARTASVAAAGAAAAQAPHGRMRRASLASRRRHTVYERFTAASFVTTAQGDGDLTAGEDPTIRAAAIDALGNMNGTAVVINPANGRILAMVNQKMALVAGS
jgi:penicillin-binding protein 2